MAFSTAAITFRQARCGSFGKLPAIIAASPFWAYHGPHMAKALRPHLALAGQLADEFGAQAGAPGGVRHGD